MDQARFGLVGGGWRAEFFLRVAQALPDQFAVTGMMVRDEAKGRRLEQLFGVQTFRRFEEMLATGPEFVVVSVPWAVSPVVLQALASRGIPALAETPPAPDVEGLIKLHDLARSGAKIQVAEQYHLQPLHAARLWLTASGRLGRITQAQISVCHGYHGVSLIRRFLGVRGEECTLTARRFESPLIAGPNRDGPPAREETIRSTQTIAQLDFGDRLGIYDFTGDQYFSWIRSPRVLVRGDRGEINNTTVRYLQDYQTPITLELRRDDAGQTGNLEGYFHRGILAGSEWAYRNPFVPARLEDDEIAVADCLRKMAIHARGGPGFYGLAEAAQDHYLSLKMDEAADTGQPVRAAPQPWAADI